MAGIPLGPVWLEGGLYQALCSLQLGLGFHCWLEASYPELQLLHTLPHMSGQQRGCFHLA